MAQHHKDHQRAIKLLKGCIPIEPLAPRGPLAFGYTRVSRPGQVAHGASLPVQAEIVKRLYDNLAVDNPEIGWGGVFEDPGESAWTQMIAERPEGKKLCMAVRPGDHIIFSYMDRAFRKQSDALAMIELWGTRKIFVHFSDFALDTSTASGWAIFSVLSTFNEYFSRLLSEKIRASNAYRKKKSGGKAPLGRTPYGLKTVGRKGHKSFVPDPLQVEWGSWIVDQRDSGMTWAQIAYQARARYMALAQTDRKYLKWRDKWEWGPERCRQWYGYEMRRRGEANGNGKD